MKLESGALQSAYKIYIIYIFKNLQAFFAQARSTPLRRLLARTPVAAAPAPAPALGLLYMYARYRFI
jgi:hypothetical protein